jgi:ATP-dependent Clp protease ATP-binding subunit ClpC
VLFDEVEKAHRDVLQVLLPVLDEGRLTDNHGRTVTFRDTVIIFTSNLGSDVRTAKPAPGFRPARDDETRVASDERQAREAYVTQVQAAIARELSPELRNRIHDIVLFQPIDRDTATVIARRHLDRLTDRIRHDGIELRCTEEALGYLVDRGFSRELGVRELQRAIDHLVVRPLSRLVLAGDTTPGTVVTLRPDGDAIQLDLGHGVPTATLLTTTTDGPGPT